MELHKLVYDLLFKEQCVIVPELGGFITRDKAAGISHESGLLHPKTKSVFFNAHMLYDDGLLLNYVSSIEKVTFEEARALVAAKVALLKKNLELHKRQSFGRLGDFILNQEGNIILRVDESLNLDIGGFGLEALVLPPKKKQLSYKPLIADEKSVSNEQEIVEKPIELQKSGRRKRAWIPVAASLVLLASLGILFFTDTFNQPKMVKTVGEPNTKAEASVLPIGDEESTESEVISEGNNQEAAELDETSSADVKLTQTEQDPIHPDNLNQNNSFKEEESTDQNIEYQSTEVENTDVLNEKYLVVLGSFLSEQNAQRYSEILAEKGVEVILMKRDGSSLKRLVYSGAQERNTATEMAQSVKEKFQLNAIVFDNQ